MDVGTDKATPEMRARVPHHCLDLVEPDEPFTVAGYVEAAHQALARISASGRVALLVGGTGLYLRAVARGVPVGRTGIDAVARQVLEERLSADGLAGLVAELRRKAPSTAAATDLANPRRVIRALERVAVHGDRPPPQPEGYPAPVMWLGLQVGPEEHRDRISSRAKRQFHGGLPNEAAWLLARYGPEPRAFSAFGYREALGMLGGELSTDEAIARTIARTWTYGRRQRTWFRGEAGITWLHGPEGPLDDAATLAVELFLEAVDVRTYGVSDQTPATSSSSITSTTPVAR